jgi:hypothetical protein
MWMLVGAALAGVDTAAQVGAGATFAWSPCGGGGTYGSPFLFSSVDIGSTARTGTWAFVGMDSSFFLSYSGDCGDVFVTNALMLTSGVWLGSDRIRVGGLTSIGLGGLAVGGRVALMTERLSNDWRYGVEVRVETLPGLDPTLVQVAYVVAVP